VIWHLEQTSLPRSGETENGDAVLAWNRGGVCILAVVDALGHGPHAATAARAAIEELRQVEADAGLSTIVQRLHERLRGTRGVAAFVAKLALERIEACSIGNVEARTASGNLPVVLTPGVLGLRFKAPRIFRGPARVGERLVVFTDGISSRFTAGTWREGPRQELCRSIMSRYRRAHDDATVVVADLEA
jgi:negative regulator of sigma-B (phosphoserine phosphatase)